MGSKKKDIKTSGKNIESEPSNCSCIKGYINTITK